ncbi:unnamed protein product [Lepeophtheirus salmonis]|uniref:(salmon louse) hypothetical protein n=1 Tax=Lepeophtheirus salmonis TaxID=72036 RepID=A0A7R8CPV9_LEPSM|nr:unnamed protein product [Lepeophtheirus salmonis]CAF2852157.1 unnamed protein product [Lepeophtheirus salmonis]
MGLFECSPAHFYYSSYYRTIQLRANDVPRKVPQFKCIPISEDARNELKWWANLDASLCKAKIYPAFDPDFQIYTDASRSGWGISFSGGQQFQGKWSITECLYHINSLEMLQCMHGIKCYTNGSTLNLNSVSRKLSSGFPISTGSNNLGLQAVSKDLQTSHKHVVPPSMQLLRVCNVPSIGFLKVTTFLQFLFYRKSSRYCGLRRQAVQLSS